MERLFFLFLVVLVFLSLQGMSREAQLQGPGTVVSVSLFIPTASGSTLG
jgi:hypothetical protein